MKSTAIKITIVSALVAIAAYWYWSPFLVVRQLLIAAQNKDAIAFNTHVDYTKLRESVKEQLSEKMADKMEKPADSDNPFARAGAALGQMLGKAMVNPLVDALVRPETLMHAMENGRLPGINKQSSNQSDNQSDKQADDHASGDNNAPAKEGKYKWSYTRQNADTLIAYLISTAPATNDDDNQRRFGLVLQRSGFANWSVTGIRLP